jgi:hypothetical protein
MSEKAVSDEWLHVEITGGRNAGTNRKPRIEVQFSDLDGNGITVQEGVVFMDCNQALFRVGVTEGGWTRIKMVGRKTVKRGPGRGPYKIVKEKEDHSE